MAQALNKRREAATMLDLLALALDIALLPEGQRHAVDAWIRTQLTGSATDPAEIYRKMKTMFAGEPKIPA